MTALRRTPKPFLALGLVILFLVAGGVAFGPKLLAVYYTNRGWLALNQAMLTDLDEVTRAMEERAPEFRALAGLQQKYYLQGTKSGEYAGLYLRDTPDALAAF